MRFMLSALPDWKIEINLCAALRLIAEIEFFLPLVNQPKPLDCVLNPHAEVRLLLPCLLIALNLRQDFGRIAISAVPNQNMQLFSGVSSI